MPDKEQAKRAEQSYNQIKELYDGLQKELKEADSNYRNFLNEIIESNPELVEKTNEKFKAHEYDRKEIHEKYSEAIKAAKQKGVSGQNELRDLRNKRAKEYDAIYDIFFDGIVEDVESAVIQDPELDQKYFEKKEAKEKVQKKIDKINALFDSIYEISKSLLPIK